MKTIDNYTNVIESLDSKLIKDYHITEAFFIGSELHITSVYELPLHVFDDLEKQFLYLTTNN